MSVNNQLPLTMDNLSPAAKAMKFRIHGELMARAKEIAQELERGVPKPFDKMIRAHSGDMQAIGQKPITFLRQVMALCSYPALMSSDLFPQDAKEKAQKWLRACFGQSIGAYADFTGIEIVRQAVVEFIERRDGVPTCTRNIFLTPGANYGARFLMKLFINESSSKPAGFMIPIPQYPLFSATIVEYGAETIGYYLDEENNWALDIDELERAYQESLDRCEPRVICVINPGNPTGQVLSLENIQAIIKWAYGKKLFIIADEVYQENIYAEGAKFHSFKKTAYELGEPYSKTQIGSLFSISKGFLGECGTRGGYFEIINMEPELLTEMEKLNAVQVYISVLGQICLGTAMDPPKHGDPSYDLFIKEKNEIFSNLKEKAILATELINKIEGIKCCPIQGAFYAFPQIKIPKKAIDHAKLLNMEPDLYYCMEFMNQTGVFLMQGSTFLQRPGTYHFRLTICPSIDEIKTLFVKLDKFQKDFLNKWS